MINRYKELIEIINKANSVYYNEETPIMTDAEYDTLYSELKAIEKDNKDLPLELKIESPTNKVGAVLTNNNNKVEHITKKLSLDNVHDEDELFNFFSKLNIEFDGKYILQHKLDGLNITLIYKDGILENILTRGDGYFGESIIDKIEHLKNIYYPSKLKDNIDIEVVGELLINTKELQELQEQGLFKDTNARNLAAGSIRLKDKTEISKRPLMFTSYEIIYNGSDESFLNKISSQEHTIKWLGGNNFNTLPILSYGHYEGEVYDDIEEVCEVISDIEANLDNYRKSLCYDIDGLVIKINDKTKYKEIGTNNKFPKYAVAYKFPNEVKTTKILNVIWQVGRTGRLTPVAKLEPVEINGVTVSNCTLHNPSIIRNMNLKIGSIVKIIRADEVIPKIVGLQDIYDNDENTTEIEIPNKCPDCGGELEITDTNISCISNNCTAKLIAQLEHFCSRDCMNIGGLGLSTIETIVKTLNVNGETIIKDISSLYELKNHRDILLNIEGFGEKKVDSILHAIENSKANSVIKLCVGLGIHMNGNRRFKEIFKETTSIHRIIADARDSDIISEKYEADKYLYEYFKNDDNIEMIKKLESYGLKTSIEENVMSTLSKRLTGLVFGITGGFNISRNLIISDIESNGGEFKDSITKNTTHVLVGDGASSSKLEKIKKMNIATLNYDEYLKLKQ